MKERMKNERASQLSVETKTPERRWKENGNFKILNPRKTLVTVAVSCGYDTCFAVKACDGLCHLTKSMGRIETPLGFQSIVWTFVRHTVSRCLISPALQFLPTGQHGLCFGYLFSGLLPLRSLIDGPPFGVRFRESLVIRLYSEIDQIHLSIEAQCGSACLSLGDCHSNVVLINSR